ncbi:MAG: HlyD family efflux transporter periplasmic adaptor subunit [Gammaproteobacteria bacterium]
MRSVLTGTVMVALLAGCGEPQTPLPLVGTLERDRIEVPAQAWETLVEIPVQEADTVTKGQLLARQDPSLLLARVKQAQAAEERAERRLAELVRGPRKEDISAARARLEGAKSQLSADEKAFQRTATLVEKRLLSEADLDNARARLEVAQATRDEAAARLAELIEGATKEELEQARAELEEQRARVMEQTLDLERLELRAPVNGMVDSVPFAVGDRPTAGTTVMVLLADTAPFARVYVPETMRVFVSAGLSALVRVDGISDAFEGRVRTVSSEAVFTPYFALTERDRGRLAYVAEIDLIGETAAALPTGLPVEVTFPGIPDMPAR